MKPSVGLPVMVEMATCGFQADLASPFCESIGTVHLAMRDPAWGVVSLMACAGHELIARATGEVLAEHPARHECRFTTGECWS